MIELDGSAGEGGGQILRTGLALAMLTQRPLHIHHIRARRPKPGLMRQHLACVQAAQAVSAAQVQGAELGATTLHFQPGPVRAGSYHFAVGTAGSCTLVLQTVLPALLRASGPSQLRLSGGTHNPLAPPFHHLQRCWAPLLQRLGAGLSLSLRRLGFYPAGGGEFSATITPPASGRLQPFNLESPGPATEAWAEALAPALPRQVAERELAVLGRELGWRADQLRLPPTRQNEGPGNALIATLAHAQHTEVFTAFGSKGVSAERVAADLAREVLAWADSGAALGPHTADQWALPLAMAVCDSGQAAHYHCAELTEHTRTNLAVIAQVLPVQVHTGPVLDAQGQATEACCVTLAPR